MAALSLANSCSLQTNQNIPSIQEFKSRIRSRRTIVVVCCQREKKELKEGKRFMMGSQIGCNTDKFLKGMKENMSPKQQGDWKDVVLMSLAFAVYVYISQQLVCAYCAWNSMLKHPW